MHDRPSGEVALLFTDVEGSTQRWEEHREAMGEAMRLHDRLLRVAIEARRGFVFKTVGDSFYAVFTDVADAANAAVDAQRALGAVDFSAVGGLRVRIALHVGTCEERDDDYFGPAVNRIARLLRSAHGGQVLLSSDAVARVDERLPEGASLEDFGFHRLKDLAQPERIAGLIAPGLDRGFPPLRSLSTMANNLPRYLTPIVGRVGEIAAVEALLRESPLVTISGAGGIGKTRVGVQVAANLLSEEADGAWFADLAPLGDPGLLATTVANAIGLEVGGSADPAAALATLLRPRRLIVVLDNCEHLIDATARLAESIVRTCPHVRILATSREPLGIAGESVYRLGTLDDEASLALFVACSQRADQTFALRNEDRRTVVEICRRLDGIALAIELAAARGRVMPPKQLLARLDERFRLLAGGSRTALPRQQTLRALIDWSYDRLSEEHQAVLRRLGIFSAGFTVEAALAVAGVPGIESWELLDQISALIEKSLLLPATDGTQRYRMLESIHQYALGRLSEAREEDRARRSHAAYFADLSESVANSFGAPGVSEEAWLAQYEPELDNFRMALDWTLANDVRTAAHIAGNLADYWAYCNVRTEGLRRSEIVLWALGEDARERDVLDVLLAIGLLSRGPLASRRALESAERALEIATRISDAKAIAQAKETIGLARFTMGAQSQEGLDGLRDAVEFYRTQPKPLQSARAMMAYCAALGHTALDRSRKLLEEVLALNARSPGWPRTAMIAETYLAELEFYAGEYEQAILRVKRVVEACRRRNSPNQLGNALTNLSCYLSVAGDHDAARAAAQEAVGIARALDMGRIVTNAVQSLAVGMADRGDAHAAAYALGYVDAHYETHGTRREPTEELVRSRLTELLGRHLGEAEIAAAESTGRELSEDEVCALVLGEAGLRV